MWGRLWRFDALAQLGDLDAAAAEVGHLEAIAARLRSPLADWHVARCRAAMAAARGRYGQALEFGQAAEAAAARTGTEGAHVPSKALILLVRQQLGTLDRTSIELALLPRTGPVTDFIRSVHAATCSASASGTRRTGSTGCCAGAIRCRSSSCRPTPRWSSWRTSSAIATPRPPSTGLLQPHADLFVCSGAGVVLILGPVHYPLGIAAAAHGAT